MKAFSQKAAFRLMTTWKPENLSLGTAAWMAVELIWENLGPI
jgi:hypothetical protein